MDSIAKRFDEASHDTSNHFVEGLQYSLDEGVIMTGVMVPDHEVDYRNVTISCSLPLMWRQTEKIENIVIALFPNRLTMSANGTSHGFSSMLRAF